VCRFHVVADTGSAPCQRQWHQPSEDSLPPTGRFNLDFILRENFLLCSSYLPLGVSQHAYHPGTSSLFLAPLPGRKKLSARGVSHSQSLYFVFFCLVYFIFYCLLLYIKNTKKNSFFNSCYFCFPVLSLIFHHVIT
jgi:hypothetical protein